MMTTVDRNDIRAMVDDYLHDLLSPEDAEFVNRRLATSRLWQVALDEARQRRAALEAAPAGELPEALVRRTLERVEREARARRHVRRLVRTVLPAALAAAVLVIGSLNVYYATLAPTPLDIRVLGQRTLLPEAPSSIRVRLARTDTGAALAGVPVDLELADPATGRSARLASFTSDARGTGRPRFVVPGWADGDYELRVVARPRGKPETLRRPVRIERSWRLMLDTDKPAYQPGQTIRVRTLALRRADGRPCAGREVTFAVTDPKGNVIFRRPGITSRFGIASMDCPLASEIVEGPYTIECRLGDTPSQRTVDVKAYVLPKLAVDLELDRPWYGPGERLAGTVRAGYFFGRPVAGADVAVEIVTEDVEPVVLERLTARTDGSGLARFEGRLPGSLIGRPREDGDGRIEVRCTVTDTAGQRHTEHVSRLVTLRPIRVELVPECGTLVRGLSNTIYVVASYADGSPAAGARVLVGGLDRELVMDDLGAGAFELTPRSDQVELTVQVTDGEGRIGRERVALGTGAGPGDFLIGTDRAVYRGGDTVTVTARGAGPEPVFLDLVKDGRTILVDAIELDGGQGQHAIDLPPDALGPLRLTAYRFAGPGGRALVRSRTIRVTRPEELRVRATLDRETYRPGATATLRVQVTDPGGRPAPGAVSLVAVDEAVHAVRGPRPDPGSTPDRLDGSVLEQALAARTASRDDDRAAPLRRLVEDGYVFEDDLEVLDSPDFEDHLARLEEAGRHDERVLSVLRGEGGVHTMRATSYPAKVRQTAAVRTSGLRAVVTAWIVLGVTAGALGLVYLLVRLPDTGCLLLLVLGVLVLIGLLLPALGRARYSDRGPHERAMVRTLGDALQLLEENTGALRAADGAPPDAGPPHLRRWFPETLLWRPELITDDQGAASLEIELADSITTWRLDASAVTADGRLGATGTGIRVFQPFFVDLDVPVALTRGDEVAVPVVVYSYLDRPQRVTLAVSGTAWFTLLDEHEKTLDVEPGAVRSASFTIRADRAGRFDLEVTARGEGVGDAVRRPIEVVPDGTRVEHVRSGTLADPLELEVNVPAGAVEGSLSATLRIHPSSFAQVVEGLDAIFERPYGCFEQTSSTTYPNVLALDYLRRTKRSVPEVEARARRYIHLGYQRLLGFEVPGGGFDWFGNPPAETVLTAYGLMEFQDMAAVHEVDPDLIDRTRRWLLEQRRDDGTWSAFLHRMHDDPAAHSRLATTAYVSMAVFPDGTREDAWPTREYLLGHAPERIRDPHTLGLVCNALIGLKASELELRPYLDRLKSMGRVSADRTRAWWPQALGSRTTFHGAGLGGAVETTALAALALLRGGRDLPAVRGALRWIVEQKDGYGTWHSTQATVLALKALLAGAPLGADRERRVDVEIDGRLVEEIVIGNDQGDVVRQVGLTSRIGPGRSRVTVRELTETGAGYQLALAWHVPRVPEIETGPGLAIDVAYDRRELAVADVVTATATVRNDRDAVAPMVILDLPVPGGFAPEAADFDAMVREGRIAKHQITPTSVVVYLRELGPGATLELTYGLRATMPVRVTVPPATVYEYYDPDTRASSGPARLVVSR